MREKFAAWYLAEVTQSYGEGVRDQAEKNLAWKREDGSFADPMLRLACLAWEASRAALVVELPEAYHTDTDGHWLIRRAEAKQMIEAQGLKVMS